MKDKYFKIEEEVPYDLKEAVREAGGTILPAHNRMRKNNALWVTDTEEKQKKIYEIIHSYKKNMDNSKKETEKIEKLLVDDKQIKEEKNSFYFSIPEDSIISITENGTYDWTRLLSEDGWDALVAVQMIRKYGLPQKESERERLLDHFAKRIKGEQYNIIYEDLCEYSAIFRKAYGPETVKKALEAADIKDGFNFSSNVNNSTAISEEVKKLLSFVFPIVKREREEPEREEERYI